MKRKKGYNTILVAFFGFTLIAPMLMGVTLNGFFSIENNPVEMANSFKASAITIDGNLTPGEWDDAEHVISWYMDADPENYDGYNYMYLAEDKDNLYIALDLVSDQTDDISMEWMGVWLNTNETIVDEADGYNATKLWEAALNNGLESLIYDVDNSREMPYFDPNGGMAGFQTNLKSLSELSAINGTFDGTLEDISGWDGVAANMTAVQNGTDYIYRLDVDINIADYYNVFKELYADHTQWVDFKVKSQSNTTLRYHYLTIRDSMGTIDLANPNKTLVLSNGTVWDEREMRVTQGNFTEDNRILLSLIGIGNQPFNMSFDKMTLTFMANSSYHSKLPYLVGQPYTSINDYEIAWAFWGTENNATAHRSFEIKIPKSELEGYEMDKDLGVLIGGYGTLASWPNTHNWVFGNGTETGIPYDNTTAYLYYSMPLKGWVPTTTSTHVTTSMSSTASTSTTSPTGSTPTTSTTTTSETTAPTPVVGAEFIIIIIVGAAVGIVLVVVIVFKMRK